MNNLLDYWILKETTVELDLVKEIQRNNFSNIYKVRLFVTNSTEETYSIYPDCLIPFL